MRRIQEKIIFGLDIGTRSIVGTVGYQKGDRFVVMAQRTREHETRAMLDGQIHDIKRVSTTILEVKKDLEKALNMKLKEVCIAAAGRVLKTITTNVEMELNKEREISIEDIYALTSRGIEQAYEELAEENDTDMKFYCVGNSVIRYYLNKYPITNLEGHTAKTIGADLIATFLPDDVVDGLYKAVENAGLNVANLTLEPIAAIQVAIPEKFRMLNIALVDVGAGTSDISITKDGSIIAYGMIPTAGDYLTEAIAAHCLVDFQTAEHMKRQLEIDGKITYTDIMGLSQNMTLEEMEEILKPEVEKMAKQVAETIRDLNGNKTVSAVFIVGGGGKINGYTQALAKYLDIVQERVALRGEEVMQSIDFLEDDVVKDSLLVTPVGICLSYYSESNNFIYVDFNGKKIKIYNNNHLAVVDAAMQADFPHDALFPRRGKELKFTVNGKNRVIKGTPGEPAQIYINGEEAGIYMPIHANDVIRVEESTRGDIGRLTIGQLPEFRTPFEITVNDKKTSISRITMVNGNPVSEFYDIAQGDQIEIQDFCLLSHVMEILDVTIEPDMDFYVNDKEVDLATKVYEKAVVRYVSNEDYIGKYEEEEEEERDRVPIKHYKREEPVKTQTTTPLVNNLSSMLGKSSGLSAKAMSIQQMIQSADIQANLSTELESNQTKPKSELFRNQSVAISETATPEKVDDAPPQWSKPQPKSGGTPIMVIVNGKPTYLRGKSSYIYVDVFDFIDFDLSKPQGKGIVTNLNGRDAQYMEPINAGDVIDIYWRFE